MSEQFISVITNEAMSRICYDGGWNLKPYMFFISQTDVLEQYSEDEIFNKDGSVKPAIFEYLKDLTTENMDTDYVAGNVWFSANFSSVSKANSTTLTHHINIPGDLSLDSSAKQIRTVYFIYQDAYGQSFLYALARANATLLFESGVSQSFFFNFTVTNSQTQEMTEFILNYSCAHEVEDHNVTWGDNIHSNLVARDGTRKITGILNYSGIGPDDFTKPEQLVSKAYVDKYIKDYVIPLINNTVCPPGTLYWWPGNVNTVPEGWSTRFGQWLNVNDNPGLYALLGTRYGSQTKDGKAQFRLMDDRALFIRGCEYNTDTKVYNHNYLSGVAFGGNQTTGAPNIYAQWSSGNTDGNYHANGATHIGGAGGGSGRRNGRGTPGITFNAYWYSSVYKEGLKEVRPMNRNYLPIIRLG